MKLAGVLGWPVGHSLSPRLHGYWLRQYGIDGVYLPLAVEPTHLEAAISGLPALGFSGANVTVPHKENAVRFLNGSGGLGPVATRIRAVNTIEVRSGGQLYGESTDGAGFLAALREQAPGWATELPAVVLGAGGTARAVIDALHGAGVPEIRVVNRTPARIDHVSADLGIDLRGFTWGEAARALAGAGLLVNTTSLGMAGQADLTLPLSPLPLAAVVFDCVYRPLDTGLLRQAAQRGHPCVSGLDMLIHQAVPGFSAWFGVVPEITPAVRAHLEQAP